MPTATEEIETTGEVVENLSSDVQVPEVVKQYVDNGNLLLSIGGSAVACMSNVESSAASERKITFLEVNEGNISFTKSVYRTVAKTCAYLADADGLAGSFIETFLEMNSKGFENRLADSQKNAVPPTDANPAGEGLGSTAAAGTKTGGGKRGPTNKDSYVTVFDTLCREVNCNCIDKPRGMDEVQKKFVYNWWVYGMVLILKRFGVVTVPGAGTRKVTMPIEMECLDPLRVDLDKLKSSGIVAYEFPDATKNALKAYIAAKGDINVHPLISLWPEKVDPLLALTQVDRTTAAAMIVAGKAVPLPPDKITLVRRVFKDAQTYPVPYLVRYFPAADDKQTLRQMDRSIVRKIINLILLITVKPANEKERLTPEHLRAPVIAFENRMQNYPDRVQTISVPGTTEYKYIEVPTSAFYKLDNYKIANYEAFCALFGAMANDLLAEGTPLDLISIMKAIQGKNELCLQAWIRMMEEIYDTDVIKLNKMQIPSSGVKIVPKRISILDTDAFKQVVLQGVKSGILPAKVMIDYLGEDYEWIKDILAEEAQERVQRGIFIGYPSYVQSTFNRSTDTSNPGNPAQTASNTIDNQTVTPTPGKPEGPNSKGGSTTPNE